MECPICIGMGENAEEECDKTTKYCTCNDMEAVCVSIKSGGLLMRECFNRNYYLDTLKPNCAKTEGCESAMCTFTQRCKARLPSSGIEGNEWIGLLRYGLNGLCHAIFVHFQKLNGVFASVEFQI